MEAPAEGLEGRPRPAEVTLADACLPLEAPHIPPCKEFSGAADRDAAVPTMVPATVAPTARNYLVMELIEGSTLKGRCRWMWR